MDKANNPVQQIPGPPGPPDPPGEDASNGLLIGIAKFEYLNEHN